MIHFVRFDSNPFLVTMVTATFTVMLLQCLVAPTSRSPAAAAVTVPPEPTPTTNPFQAEAHKMPTLSMICKESVSKHV
jgi:hypothetical protein